MPWDYKQVTGHHGHPNANSNGVILEHRLVMSEYLGRPLEDDEIVHHCDEIQSHNDIENLELMLKTEHSKQHSSTGKEIVTLECPICTVSFTRERRQTHLSKPNQTRPTCCSRSCAGKYSHQPPPSLNG